MKNKEKKGLVREIENFERSGVREIGSKFALLNIEKRNGTAVLLREIENFERSEFELSLIHI